MSSIPETEQANGAQQGRSAADSICPSGLGVILASTTSLICWNDWLIIVNDYNGYRVPNVAGW
ncbi:MAG: hypothetical protein R3C44_22175 [Chloroflexota bacterium]